MESTRVISWSLVVAALASGVLLGHQVGRAERAEAERHHRTQLAKIAELHEALRERGAEGCVGADEARLLTRVVKSELASMREQLNAERRQAPAAAPPPAPPPPAAAPSPESEQAFEQASRLIEGSIGQQWGDRERDEFRRLLSKVEGEKYNELLGMLISARNNKKIRFINHGDFF